MGTWKEMFTASQLRRDLLPGLRPPAGVPDIKRYERYLERIWLDHQREWVNRKMHPLENMPDYGREITNIVSDVGLLLLLEDPNRRMETLLLRFVQKGIDYYGAVQSNSNLWGENRDGALFQECIISCLRPPEHHTEQDAPLRGKRAPSRFPPLGAQMAHSLRRSHARP